MSSITRKHDTVQVREMPLELKYNCLRHLNDELLKRLSEANQLMEQFREIVNGKGQEEAIGRKQEGCQTCDGLCLECRGENTEESIRETTSSEETQDDQRAVNRAKVWDAYVECD